MIEKTFPIIENLLGNCLDLSQDMNRLLQEEMDLLKRASSAAALDIITHRKQQLINELNLFTTHLGQILSTEQLPYNRIGISAYFDKAIKVGFDITGAKESWQQITQYAARNRILNNQNGASIDLLLRRTRQSLNILKGKPQTTQLYGPDGSTKTDMFSGTIVSV